MHVHVHNSKTIINKTLVINSLQRQRIQAIETEIEGYKKSISKAQEQNEQITLLQNKIEGDISFVKKLMSISRTKLEALKTEYSTYTRTLHQTEQQLNRAQTVRMPLSIHSLINQSIKHLSIYLFFQPFIHSSIYFSF